MSQILSVVSILTILAISYSCATQDKQIGDESSNVYIRFENDKWTLYRNNKPYFIKGALGTGDLHLLKSIGGNSIVLYNNEVCDSIMDLAAGLDVSVAIVLDIKKVRFGHDYSNEDMKDNQRKWIIDLVKKYKDHPALLFWVVGNEAHLMSANNKALWQEVNHISKMIHDIDKNHPTTTTIAAFPTKSLQPMQVRVFAPDLDFISLNVYEFAHRIKRERQNLIWGLETPYVITEWNGQPPWMMPKTEWGAIIEPHSSSEEKTRHFLRNYHVLFKRDTRHCLGGYVFYWGAKQERTHTAFSLFLHGNCKTQAIETIEYCWTDTITQNHCPRINYTNLKFPHNDFSCYLPADSILTYEFSVYDPDKEDLYMAWEVKREGDYRRKFGGEKEEEPESLYGQYEPVPYADSILFKTPNEAGPFRLFVYFYDIHGNAATANLPFYTLH